MKDFVGRILKNRYRVETLIGRGGMAEVYRVWDKDRGSNLAMKLLRSDLAQDRVFLRRFTREAQNLASLEHPNIVRFYGLEQVDSQVFILMDYIDGESLQTEVFRTQGRGLSLGRILDVLRPVCSALGYAHIQGLAHCDLKPGNILIEKGGRVMLSDFGIARLIDAATTTMIGIGTPAYMAPEVIRGAPPTPQTDIYALGIILFEMLTGGERPFVGEKAAVTGTTSEKVRWEQVNLSPPSPRTYNPAVSPAIEAVMSKCLNKDPARRYISALDFLNDLEQAVSSSVPVKSTGVIPTPRDAIPQVTPAEPGLPPKELETKQIDLSAVPKARPARQRRLATLILVSGVIAVFGLMFGVYIISNDGLPGVFPIPSVTIIPTRTSTATTTQAPASSNPAITVLAVSGEGVFYQDDGPEPKILQAGSQIPAGKEIRVWTTAGEAQLLLEPEHSVYLGGNTTLILPNISLGGDPFNSEELGLERGDVLVKVTSGSLTVKASLQAFFAEAKNGTTMGLSYEPLSGTFLIDCLEGECQAGQGGVKALEMIGGQRAGYEQGIVVPVGEAQFAAWIQLAGSEVPTATFTPRPTATKTSTATPTLTPTSSPLPQPIATNTPNPPEKDGSEDEEPSPVDTPAPPGPTDEPPPDTPAPP